MKTTQIQFSNQGINLTGTVSIPDGNGPHPALVVLHAASKGRRDDPFYQHLLERLPQWGIAVLVYDRRGSGESGGKFETASFHDLAGDAAAAFDALRERTDIDGQRIGFYGISQGGWLAPIAATLRPEAAGLVIVSGSGVSPAEQMDYAAVYTLTEAGYSQAVIERALALRQLRNEYYRGQVARETALAELEAAAGEDWWSSAYLGGPPSLPEDVTLSKWHYEMDYDPLPVWNQVRTPVLFVFGEDDRWVPVAASMAAYSEATRHLPDVQMILIPGTDHLMEERGSISERYIEVLKDWLVKRL